MRAFSSSPGGTSSVYHAVTPFVDRRFVVVAGKGGVGRTTVAAAIALATVRRGRRVLLAQTRAKDPVHLLLGGPAVGEEIASIAPNLWAVNMNPRAALREYGLMVLRFESVFRAVFENRWVRAFLRAVPGLDEYAMLGKAWYHTTEEIDGAPRFDTVIFDGPATGHMIQMLRVPRVILDSVPPGPLTREAARLWSLLSDPARAVVHIVTLAEEMPVSETIDWLRAVRDDLQLPPGLLIVNGLYPDHVPEGGPAARLLDHLARVPLDHLARVPRDAKDGAAPDPAVAGVLAHARLARSRRRMQERHLARLRREVPLPTALLPQLFVGRIGPPEIAVLADLMRPALGQPSMTSGVSPASTV